MWYFDSGSLQHMTGYWLLSNVLSSSLDFVTFGDGAKGSVLKLGSLKAKLISINQLCDQDLFLKFKKDKCIVLD